MTDHNVPPTPPQPPQPVAPPAQSATTRSGARALAITFGVVGGCVLVAGGTATAFATVSNTMFAAGGETGTESLSVSGIDGIDVDLSAGEIDIEFGDVSEATLDYRSDSGRWNMDRDGDTLVVRAPDGRFTILDWSWGREQSATLTLPESLEGVDLGLDISAGEATAEGVFGDITYELGAGSVELEGSARSIDAQVSAGSSVIELADVQTASFEVAAGGVNGRLTGEPPEEILIDVSAGGVELQLPDVPYDMRIDRAAGDVTSSLQDDPRSDRLVEVRVMAGDVTLYAD